MNRVCLKPGCPELTSGSYCRRHYLAKRRPFYNRQHAKRARAAIAAEPWCHTPGGCPHPDAGTPANPLQGDHSDPRDPMSPIRPLCRRCNVTRANRGRAAAG